MKHHTWLFACLALVAAGLIAGCGGSSSDTSATNTSGVDTSSTTSTEASGQATPDDVYNACIEKLSGSAGQTVCAQARDAFEQCTTQASNAPEGTARDQALKACQDAANKATDALNASP